MNLQLIGAYVGPDQVMPLASILATVLGFLLIFWTKVLTLLRKIAALFKRSGAQPSPQPAPTESEQAAKEPPEKLS